MLGRRGIATFDAVGLDMDADDDGDSNGDDDDGCIAITALAVDGRSPSLMTDGERALLLFAFASLPFSGDVLGDPDPPPPPAPPSPSVPRRFVNSPAILDMWCTGNCFAARGQARGGERVAAAPGRDAVLASL